MSNPRERQDLLIEQIINGAMVSLEKARISTWDIAKWVMHPCQFDQFYFYTNYPQLATVVLGQPYLLGLPVEFDRTVKIDASWSELIQLAKLIDKSDTEPKKVFESN